MIGLPATNEAAADLAPETDMKSTLGLTHRRLRSSQASSATSRPRLPTTLLLLSSLAAYRHCTTLPPPCHTRPICDTPIPGIAKSEAEQRTSILACRLQPIIRPPPTEDFVTQADLRSLEASPIGPSTALLGVAGHEIGQGNLAGKRPSKL